MRLGDPEPGLRQATPAEIRAYARGEEPDPDDVARIVIEDLDHILAEPGLRRD